MFIAQCKLVAKNAVAFRVQLQFLIYRILEASKGVAWQGYPYRNAHILFVNYNSLMNLCLWPFGQKKTQKYFVTDSNRVWRNKVTILFRLLFMTFRDWAFFTNPVSSSHGKRFGTIWFVTSFTERMQFSICFFFVVLLPLLASRFQFLFILRARKFPNRF